MRLSHSENRPTMIRFNTAWLAMAWLLIHLSHRRQVNASFVFTSGGTFKLIFGYSIPIDLPTPMGINYVHNFQFQYPVVDNASQVAYVQQGARARSPRDVHDSPTPTPTPTTITRAQIYSLIERVLEKQGVDRGCVLRSVCETAAAPILDGGLVGQLFQSLLTPHDCRDASEYSVAWRAGHAGLDCYQLYTTCPHGHNFLDHVSYYM